MAKICFILVAGLDQALLARTPNLPILSSFTGKCALKPVTPAVTATMQATFSTGTAPDEHGIISNGVYAHNHSELYDHLDLATLADFRKNVSFWEQSGTLLQAPRFWRAIHKRVAMLFWQQSMDYAADIAITPNPAHGLNGKIINACWSSPSELYDELAAKLGRFPVKDYWGPTAGFTCSQWIINCAIEIWQRNIVDLELVYIPCLDYSLQRLGPDNPAVVKDLRELDAALAPLIKAVQRAGGTAIIAGDYATTAVITPILPNLVFRQAGLLKTRPDESGKLLMDYDASAAFAMVDHQIANIYCHASQRDEICRMLSGLPGVDRVLSSPREFEEMHLLHGRCGDLVALAKPDAWFAHDWWLNDAEKPAWQFTVDIHRKPGYDPRELFFDSDGKYVAQDPQIVRGSHGVVAKNPTGWPVLLCDEAIAPKGKTIEATQVAGWLSQLLIK